MSIDTDTRDLAKWLNEEPNAPIDRQVLARVLAHLQRPDHFPDAGKKVAALELALKAKTEQLSALHKQMDAAREAIASLESERAANSILTAEIAELQASAAPTYGSEEVRKLRETIASMAKIIQAMEREQGCPPFWPVVQVLLDEYGLQLIDIVAEYKKATTDQQRQDCAPIGFVGTAVPGKTTFRVEIDPNTPMPEVGTPVYAAPPKREPLSDEKFQSIKRSLFQQHGWDGDGWDLALKEAIEAAHGIGGQS